MSEASQTIDKYLESLEGWKKDNLVMFRKLVHQVVPDVEETWKWDVPVFLNNGKMFCAMSAFAKHTKFNFFTGAKLNDKDKLFNNGLESKQHRSLDMFEGDTIDQTKLGELLKQASDGLSKTN